MCKHIHIDEKKTSYQKDIVESSIVRVSFLIRVCVLTVSRCQSAALTSSANLEEKVHGKGHLSH